MAGLAALTSPRQRTPAPAAAPIAALTTLLAAVAAVLAGCASAPAGGDPFATRLRDAQRNASSAEGTMFGAAVVGAFRREPLRGQLRACQAADASVTALAGYLDFPAPAAHRIELRPAGDAQSCVARALSTDHLPEPPRYPYAIPFRWPRGL
jgi:hypothetical protein